MRKKIIVRFGDMMLKGKNIGFFIKRVRHHLVERLNPFECNYQFTHDRIFIDYHEEHEKLIIDELKRIPGIFNFSIAYIAKPDLEDIILIGIKVLNEQTYKDHTSIKIETRRTDKKFPMTSQDITKAIASPILSQANYTYNVDLSHPDNTLFIDLRSDLAYVYMSSIKGLGGFPFGTAGKGLLMMSGGIDSPVAGYLAMKQGIEIELIHFESTPLTSLESVQKVIDLAKSMAKFTPNGKIKLHLVPFTELHEAILSKIFAPYMITVMRRMMYRIAETFTKKKQILCLINGESVGQVASQTLNSMAVVEAVTIMPIIRPLVTYDKQTIIDIAKNIETYDISIRPFNDCCSIYVPKNPVTKPMSLYASKYEREIPYQEMILDAILKTLTVEVDESTLYNLMQYGFTVKEAIQNLLEESGDLK